MRCWVCLAAPCEHQAPIARSKNLPAPMPADLTAVLIPALPVQYRRKDGMGITERVRDAMRHPDGSPVIATAGDGKLHGPKVESIEGDAAERYLSGCCVPESPCARHRAAIVGRNWRTGVVG